MPATAAIAKDIYFNLTRMHYSLPIHTSYIR